MIKKIFIIWIILIHFNNSLFSQAASTGETALYKSLEKAEKELNRIYIQKAKALSIKKRNTLKKVQKQWIKHRDAKCGAIQEDGTIGNKLKLDCLIQETLLRIEKLKSWSVKSN